MEEKRLKSVEKDKNVNFAQSCEIWHKHAKWTKRVTIASKLNNGFHMNRRNFAHTCQLVQRVL